MSAGRTSRLELARLRIPIRAKLALVSAALTFVILCLFAVVIGVAARHKLYANFDDDLRATAADLQQGITFSPGDDGQLHPRGPGVALIQAGLPGEAVARIVDPRGRPVVPAHSHLRLGRPLEGLTDLGGYRVATRPLVAATLQQAGPFDTVPHPVAQEVAYLQYAKPVASVARTIARVRFFLALGVLGGTALAFLGGLLVARRAMRPIADLTSGAREVARTRDPAIALPKPEANDEVADLAHTLEDMLRELGAARAETEASLDRQREFVADASHELRTPLTSILANLELLESELDGEQSEIAGSALRSSRRMRRLVADLLLLARADAGGGKAQAAIDLAEVAREAVLEAAALGAEHQISLDAPEPVAVQGVEDDLHRLTLNLIENAIVHTPAGTPITVSVRLDGDAVVLEVADRGPGVPAEVRERLFERFSHSRLAPRDGSGPGSGLGLAIVRAVAETHGGSVELADAEGGGARFTVRLPAGAPQTSTTTGKIIGRRLSRS